MLQTDEVAAELICDGVHVHPALVRMAIAAKRPSRVMAITDGTAASGLPVGAHGLARRPADHGRRSAALLDDGTLAGSVLTMERAFQVLVGRIGLSLVDAATLCATTPARELGLVGHGVLAPDAVADLVVLDASLSVVQTYVGGRLVYAGARTSRRPIPSKRAEDVCHDPRPRVSLSRPCCRWRSPERPAWISSRRRYVDRQDKRFTVSGTPDVSLSTFDGSIEIRPWDRSEVLVTVEKHARDKADADAIEVHAEQNGNRIVVEVRRDKSQRLRHPRRLESGAQRPADRADAGVGDRGAVERRRLDRHRAHQRAASISGRVTGASTRRMCRAT